MKIASSAGPTSAFRRHGYSLRDFLENAVDDADTCDIVGARIIEHFCLDDRRFNNFLPGLTLAIGFLDATMQGPRAEAREQCLLDLRGILDGPNCDFATVLQWVRSNYE